MRFSQRIGKKKIRDCLQIESIDTSLENRLWNNFLSDLTDNFSYSGQKEFLKCIWEEFFEQRKDEIPGYSSFSGFDFNGVVNYIKVWWFDKAKWYEKYDFIEFVAYLTDHFTKSGFAERCNETLKRESAGYRILESKIVPITSEEEIQAIEEALADSESTVETHLSTALELLSNRDNPDYRNSVKESISSIESYCRFLTDDKKATLGNALAQIEKSQKIHGAMKKAFSSLYGYTSESGGIRHSLLLDDIPVTMEDAKFMLISCSAFINYLKLKNKNSH